MDLRRQIAIVRTWFPLLVVCMVLAAGAAFAISSVLPKMYEAKATLIVGQSLSSTNPDYNQLLVSQRLSTTYAAIATRRPMLENVISQLKLDVSVEGLAANVRADVPTDSTLLTITAQQTDPARAAAIANAIAHQLIAGSPALQGREAELQSFVDSEVSATQAQIEATQGQLETLGALTKRTPEQDAEIQTLEGRLISLRSTYATLLSFALGNSPSLLTVIDPAVALPDPVSPRLLLNTLLAGILGLLVAIGIAFLAEYLDDSIKDSDAVREATGLSTLGTIARMNGERGRKEMYRLAPLLYPRSSAAEAYRALRTNIEFASVDTPIRTLLVTSSVPGEGKTITAANLAIVFAQAGRRVLLVDADLRKPGINLAFDLRNEKGLTTMLVSDDVRLASLAQPTEVANLLVLTTGPLPPNPAELLGSQRMRIVIDQLKPNTDLIIVDSPPLQAVTDAAVLGSFLDGTLLVIDASRSHRRSVRSGRETIERAGANVLGVVLNRIPARGHSEYGYYGGYTEPTSAPPELAKVPETLTEPSRS